MATLNGISRILTSKLEEPVRQHLKNVYGCLAMSMTAATVGAYLDVAFRLSKGGFLFALAGVGLLLALTMTPDNGKNRSTRLAFLLGFSFCSGLGLGPLIEYAIIVDPSIIVTALFFSAAIFICFTMAALTARRGQWLYLGGTLMTLLTALVILSLANIFLGSDLLFKGYLYLGLLLMCGFVLYDSQCIIEKRRNGDQDFILHSVDLFVDFIGIFRRLVIILAQKEQQSEKKKSRRD